MIYFTINIHFYTFFFFFAINSIKRYLLTLMFAHKNLIKYICISALKEMMLIVNFVEKTILNVINKVIKHNRKTGF